MSPEFSRWTHESRARRWLAWAGTPDGHRAFAVFAIAVLVRVVLATTVYVTYDYDVDRILAKNDAPAYLAVADMLGSGLRPPNRWHERVFWGWALTLRAASFVIDPRFASVGLSIFLSGVASALFYGITRSVPVSVLYAVLPPTILKDSILGMGEPAYLCCLNLLILATLHGRRGLTFASALAALLIRPTAVLLTAVYAVIDVARRQYARAFAAILAAAIAAAIALALNIAFYGSAIQQVHAYSSTPNVASDAMAALGSGPDERHFLTIPLANMFKTAMLPTTPPWKQAYVFAILLWAIVATYLNWRLGRGDSIARLFGIWGGVHLLFIASTGPYWAFHSFDRYATWAATAYWYPFAKPLEKRERVVAAAMTISMVLAWWGLTK